MEKEELWKGFFERLGQALWGFLCSVPSVMGCYPLVPAAAAAGLVRRGNPLFLYAGLFAGMISHIGYETGARYILLVAVIFVSVSFYRMVNRRCSGMAAGLIAGVTAAAMDFSGGMSVLTGASEGLLAAGLTGLIHFTAEMAREVSKPLQGELLGLLRRNPPLPASVVRQDGRIEALMCAVDGLSEVFTSLSRPKAASATEEAGVIAQELEGTLCASCDGCAVCWRENRGGTTRSLQELLTAVIGHRSREELLEKKYLQDCARYPDLVEEAQRVFGRMELNHAWYLRLLENRQIVAQHLDAMTELLQGWSRGEKLVDDHSRLLMARIAYETKERGLLLQDLHICENARGRRYIRAMAASRWEGGIPSRKYLEALERATHSSLRLERSMRTVITHDWQPVVVYENTNYYTLPGIAMQKKDSSPISGDNFTMFELEEGYYVIGLSDGMGSGNRANQESAMVVDLLERLIKAGFARDIAIRMMNSAMVLQGENDSYSTLDLAALDLYSGELSLTKIGAAASFLKRGREVSCLSIQSLPAGADPEQTPRELVRQTEHGDFLVMVTDGVLEYLHVKDPRQCFMDMIAGVETENAGVMAKSLLEQVLRLTGGYVQDDMTILVAGIWDKN